MPTPYVFDQQTRISLSRALQLLEVFRTLDADMPIGQAVGFLMIAASETSEGSMTVTELQDKGGFALSSSSRYVQALGKFDRKRDPGLELISDEVDVMNRRRKILRTTPRGKRVVQQLTQAMGG